MGFALRTFAAVAVSTVLAHGTALACLGDLDCQKGVLGWTDASGVFHSSSEITSFPATVKYRLDFTYTWPNDRCAVGWLQDTLYGNFSFPPAAEDCYKGASCFWVYNPASATQFIEYSLTISSFDHCATLGQVGPDGSVTVANLVTGGDYFGKVFDCSAKVVCRPPPDGHGCTLTPGYWKTHSEFGPAPYDSTWANLPQGASTPFFLSGGSYLQAMQADSKAKYYILAQAYVAAVLNGFAGASVPGDVQEALNFAESFFGTHTPASELSSALRAQVIGMAYILDQYNNGYIGPGHCSE